MQKITLALGASALALAALTGAASASDRPATAAERAEAASVLRAAGFVSWRKVEFDRDDRKIEVDDARHANGRVYDVDIRGGRIIKRDLED